MEEAIASISESRQQVLVVRRLRSQYESREYPPDEVEQALNIARIGNDSDDDSDDATEVEVFDQEEFYSTDHMSDVISEVTDPNYVFRGRTGRSRLRSGPYPRTDPENVNLVER